MKTCLDCPATIAPQATRCVPCASVVLHGVIDRTPKPCHHKKANHQHGTNAAYVLDRCRCQPCTAARKEQDSWRRRQKAYGRYDKYVDAEPVRQHVRALMAGGMGLKTVSKRTGVATGTLSKLIYGVYAPGPGGRNGAGVLTRPPAKRTLRTTAERLLALTSVEERPDNLAAGALDPWRTPTARTHLRALVALGWSMSELGRRLGISYTTNAIPLFTDETRVMLRSTVDRAEAIYAELSMTPRVPTNRAEQGAITRARNFAKKHGWIPPLDLEDVSDVEQLDDYLDEQAIWRRMQGDKTVRLTTAERAELRARWVAAGRSLNELERHTGINAHRTYTTREAS